MNFKCNLCGNARQWLETIMKNEKKNPVELQTALGVLEVVQCESCAREGFRGVSGGA